MKSLNLLSPAKVNLYLKVVGKRADGYHEVKTILERIDLYDKMKFISNRSGQIRIECRNPHTPKSKDNLAYQAARLLKETFCLEKQGVEIKIEKNIPVASGLGGGSSNAASTLLALNRLWDLKLGKEDLKTFARKLGADVSFFLEDTSFALGKGRGDKLLPISSSLCLWHILVIPKFKILSSQVYRTLGSLTKGDNGVKIILCALKEADVSLLVANLYNQLEEVIFKKKEVVFKIKQKLLNLGFKGVLVSGSGPAVFAISKGKKEATQAVRRIKSQTDLWVQMVRTF